MARLIERRLAAELSGSSSQRFQPFLAPNTREGAPASADRSKDTRSGVTTRSILASRFAASLQGPAPGGAPQPDESGWQFVVLPYGWISDLEGDVTIKGLSAQADVEFSDLLERLDYAVMLHMEATHGDWSVIFEPVIMALSADESGEQKVGPATIEADLELELFQAIVELAGAYRFALVPLGSAGSGRRLSIEALGGLRYWYLDTDLDVELETTIGPRTTVRKFGLDETEQWVDPFVGLRLLLDLTEKFSISVRGDVGGFGVGSDFSWRVAAGFQYDPSPAWTLFAGYQVLDVDYEDGSGSDEFEFDVRFDGLLVGLGYRFGRRADVRPVGAMASSSTIPRRPDLRH